MVVFLVLLFLDSVESLSVKDAGIETNTIVLKKINEPLDWEHREEDDAYFPVVDNGLFEIQSRVAFSTEAPVLPPSEGSKTRSKRDSSAEKKVRRTKKFKKSRKNKGKKNKGKKNKRKNRKQNKKHRHNHGISKSRRRRSNRMGSLGSSDNYDPHPLSVCDSVSDWVQLNESTTQFGLQVQVLSHRWSNRQRLKQFIYETKCANEGEACRGIDTDNYRSECVTKKIYIDAFVRDEHGEEMWTKIEVNGSCNCKLYRKQQVGGRTSIFDILRGN